MDPGQPHVIAFMRPGLDKIEYALRYGHTEDDALRILHVLGAIVLNTRRVTHCESCSLPLKSYDGGIGVDKAGVVSCGRCRGDNSVVL